MRRIEQKELEECLRNRPQQEPLNLSDLEFRDMDLRGWSLHGINFSVSMFVNVTFDGADLSGCSIKNACLDGCSLREVNFADACMKGACMRECDMTGCNICGANLFSAVLEHANLTDVHSDERTQWFRMYCPETGPILGYKKCVGDRLVQLLIPADAKRTSATRACCRCNKAKVLTIKNFDDTQEFEEAWSLVDENFVYRKGQWVEVKDFNEDRWFDSTTGIHFWLTKAEAIAY
jgi:hypothetical protein